MSNGHAIKVETDVSSKEKAQEAETDTVNKEHSISLDQQAIDDPLLGCLVLLTKLNSRPLSVEALSAGLPLVDNKLTPELFVRAAERAGFATQMTQRSLNDISNLILPATILLKNKKACVLLKINHAESKATVLQPESGGGECELSIATLQEQYLGYCIFVRAEHKFDVRTPSVLKARSKHWFWETLLRSWRIYRDVIVASFLVNLFALASPLFIMNVYDRVVPNSATETLWVLAIGVALVFSFDFIMRTLRGYFVEIAGKKADILLSSMVFEKVLGIKMSARPPSVGAFANNLSEFESIRNFITSTTILTVIDLPFILLFLTVIALIGGSIVFIPISAIILALSYGLLIQAPLKTAVEKTFRASAQKNANLIESLTGIETIKTLGAESPVQHKWEKVVGFISKWGIRSRLLSSSTVNVAVFCQQLASVGVIVLGVYLITDLELTMGGLIACVILTGRAVAPMAQVASLATQYHQAKAAMQTLNGIMQLPEERTADHSFVHRPKLKGKIHFNNVSFSYPGQQLAALQKASFTINAGEKVGIIGRIGSGKTTIEKLILNLYEPSDGSIQIDGTDIHQIDPAELRRQIGYVPQDILLFFGTVKDNILYGIPHADDNALLNAAKLSGVSEFIDRHPLGFDMPVGERGECLSGGQRQSIAIARALLSNPPVLILDEPCNSMDNTSEERFKANLAKIIQDKTLVLVTHKASLLELVQRIIVIDNGIIRADGPKEKVIEALKRGQLKVAPK